MHPDHSMTSEPDIFRAAKLLIDQHGENAGPRAAARADQLLDAADMIGAATWWRILKAIEELKRGRREGEPVNWPQRPRPSGGLHGSQDL
jgi:hypothetical protein